MAGRQALFLDKDGVISVDHGYVATAKRTDFIDGIFELCRMASEHGYLNVVVTNQAGIGRGYYTEADFLAYMDWMRGEFYKQGAQLDAIYYCPHHPVYGQGRYLSDCDCRKPKPGMLHAAVRNLGIDVERSVMIGDKVSDVEAAVRAGIGRIYLLQTNDTRGRTPELRDHTSVWIVESLGVAMDNLFSGSAEA